MSEPTKDHVSAMRHALGLREPGDDRPPLDRNYFCASERQADMEQLVAMGFMRRGRSLNDGQDRYYHVTPKGRTLVGDPRVFDKASEEWRMPPPVAT